MPEWAANTPWWVVAGIAVAFVGAIVRISMWAGAVNADRASFKTFMSEIRGDIKKILERLPPPKTVDGASPFRLTDFGRKISAAVSAGAWAADHAPGLAVQASEKEEFEIFETCVAYVTSRFEEDEEFQRTIRAAAYTHGTEPEQVRKVYEIELRDRLLQPAA